MSLFINIIYAKKSKTLQCTKKKQLSGTMNFSNWTCQMAYYTEPSGNSSIESVQKRAGTFKKHLAGDLMNRLSLTSNMG